MADPLARCIRHDPLVGAEAREKNHKVYTALWHQRGVVALDPETVLDDWIRQAIINEAEKQYGKRKGQ